MIANTTHDRAGMPWNSDRIGDRKRSIALERTIKSANAPPTVKAPASPARIRRTVESTSANIEPVEKISMQRQNTSIKDGNRKRGKNSEANCQSNITTTNGSIDEPSRLVVLSSIAANAGVADRGALSLIFPAPGRSSRQPDRTE